MKAKTTTRAILNEPAGYMVITGEDISKIFTERE